jgi:hypothetical protein
MAKSIDGDMHTFKPHFASNDMCVGLGNLNLAFTQTFDFASVQHNASFNDINDCVVVSRLAIAGDDLWAVVFHSVL